MLGVSRQIHTYCLEKLDVTNKLPGSLLLLLLLLLLLFYHHY